MFSFIKRLLHHECQHKWYIKRHTAALVNGQKHPVAICRHCGALMTADGILQKRVPLVRS